MKYSSIIPSRFILMMTHLILLLTLIQSREMNVKRGLPLDYSPEEYKDRDNEYLGGLIAGIALSCVEFIGFVSGISMFAALPSLFSALCHGSATVCLLFMLTDVWDSQLYWLIFGFCSVLPSLLEVGVVIRVVVFKKNV